MNSLLTLRFVDAAEANVHLARITVESTLWCGVLTIMLPADVTQKCTVVRWEGVVLRCYKLLKLGIVSFAEIF